MDILLINHPPIIFGGIRHQLLKFGFEPTEVPNGEAALQHLDDHPVDVLITGWGLPGISGIELAYRVRRHTTSRYTPILLITKRDRHEHLLLAVEAGVNAYLLRPVKPHLLKAKLDEIAAGEALDQHLLMAKAKEAASVSRDLHAMSLQELIDLGMELGLITHATRNSTHTTLGLGGIEVEHRNDRAKRYLCDVLDDWEPLGGDEDEEAGPS